MSRLVQEGGCIGFDREPLRHQRLLDGKGPRLVAGVPDLKSCVAFGNSPEDAVAEVSIAIDAWLDAARDAGLEIPKPRLQPHHEAAE